MLSRHIYMLGHDWLDYSGVTILIGWELENKCGEPMRNLFQSWTANQSRMEQRHHFESAVRGSFCIKSWVTHLDKLIISDTREALRLKLADPEDWKELNQFSKRSTV